MLKKLIEWMKSRCRIVKYRKYGMIGVDMGEPGGDHTVTTEIRMKDGMIEVIIALERFSGAMEIMTKEIERLGKEIRAIMEEEERRERQKTNNWRKMHHLPMKRKRQEKKNGEKAVKCGRRQQ